MRLFQFAAFAALFAACAGSEPIDVKPGGACDETACFPTPTQCELLESAPFMTWQMVVRWHEAGCQDAQVDAQASPLFVDETDQLDDSASQELIEAVLP